MALTRPTSKSSDFGRRDRAISESANSTIHGGCFEGIFGTSMVHVGCTTTRSASRFALPRALYSPSTQP
jgi:hypothetical protein